MMRTGSISQRFWLAVPAAAFVAAAAFGCEASTTNTEPTGASSEALIRLCPAGWHSYCAPCKARYCPLECGCALDDPSPPPPPLPCVSSAKLTAGFDNLALTSTPQSITSDPTFADQLTAAGCLPTGHSSPDAGPVEPRELSGYNPGGGDNIGGWNWAIASCPSMFTIPANALMHDTAVFLQPDSCTGDPGPGRVILAWAANGPCQILPNGVWQCIFPDGTCTGATCLAKAQQQMLDPDGGAAASAN
jgi:hypothetical protein